MIFNGITDDLGRHARRPLDWRDNFFCLTLLLLLYEGLLMEFNTLYIPLDLFFSGERVPFANGLIAPDLCFFAALCPPLFLFLPVIVRLFDFTVRFSAAN